MQCEVYRSGKKLDTYLFVEQKDDFTRVPEALMKMLGRLEHVMGVDLSEREQLAQMSTKDLEKTLTEQGYYLQLPPSNYVTT